MTVRAAIYARLSSDRDLTKLGVDAQLADCRKLAAEKGWTVVGEYVDPAVSAANKNARRPNYEALVADYRRGAFDALVAWDLDRLTRQPRQLEDWIDAAEEKDLLLVTANGEADLRLESGRLFARIKVSVAKAETEAASRRQRRNVQARRENGHWHGGSVPYGYRTERADNGRMILKPELAEAGMLQEAAKRLIAGDSMYGITSSWNQAGKTTDRVAAQTVHGKTMRQGRHWRQTTLRTMLLNRVLLGENKGGIRCWEPVLDETTFEKVEQRLRDPSRTPPNPLGRKSSKYTMAGGLSFCSKCGQRMVAQTRVFRDGTKRARLICSPSAVGPTACGGNQIDHDRVETLVIDVVQQRLNASPRWYERMAEPDPHAEAELEKLRSVRDDLEGQRRRANDAFVRGLLSEREHEEHLSRVTRETEDVDARLSRLYGDSVASDLLAGDLEWAEWTPSQKRSVLSTMVSRVEILPWPAGVSRGVGRRRGESAEQHGLRSAAHHEGVVARRVRAHFRDGVTWPKDALPSLPARENSHPSR